MNCSDFDRRMHQRLDNRWPLETDDELCQHAEECDHCRGLMETWSAVAQVLPAEPKLERAIRRGKEDSRSLLAIVAVAAAILWMVSMAPHVDDSVSPRTVAVVEPTKPTPPAALTANPALAQTDADQVDLTLWWQNMQNKDWVGQTMPAVRSVQEGVAPIGRSLRRAVTILTTGGGAQTS